MRLSVLRAATVVGLDRSARRSSIWLRTAAVFVASTSLSVVLMAMALAAGVLTGVEARDAHRAPQTSEDVRAKAIGHYRNMFATPPLSVILVQAAGDVRRNAPPGLPRWPGRGEAFVSPLLAARHPVGSASPWGRVVGVIRNDGLANPNEQYVYANPASHTLADNGEAVMSWGGASGYSGDNATNHSVDQFLWLMGLFLLAPALFLVGTATRLRSPTMRRALDTFEGFGAGASFRVLVALSSVAAPVGAATALSLLGAGALLMPAQIPLGIAGVIIQHEDVVRVAGPLVAAAVAGGLITCLVAIWSMRRPRHRTSVNITTTFGAGRGWIAVAAPLSAAALLFVGRLPEAVPVDVRVILVMVLFTVFLFSVPFVVSAVVSVGATMAHRRTRGPVGTLAARFAAATVRTAELIAAGLVISMALLAVTELYAGFYGEETMAGLRANDTVAKRALVMRAPADPAYTAAEVHHTIGGPDLLFLPVKDAPLVGPDEVQEVTVLQGTCAQFAALGATTCTPTTTTVADLDSPLLDAAAAYLPEAIAVTSAPPATASTQFVVASTTGAALDKNALTARGFAAQLNFAEVGDEWAGSASFTQHQLRWLTLFVVPGTVLLMAGLVLGSWTAIRRRLAALRPLLVLDPRSRMLWGSGAAGLLAPLLISVLVGMGVYLTIGGILGQMYDGLRVSASDVAVMGVSAAAASIVFWLCAMATVTSPAARQSATWQDQP